MENAFCDPIYSKQYGTWQRPRPLDDHCILHLSCTFCATSPMASHNGIARCHKASNLAWRRFYLKAVRDFATIIKHELLDVSPNEPVPGLMNYLDFVDTLGLEESSDEESQEEPSEPPGIIFPMPGSPIRSWRSENFHLLDFGSLPRPSQH